MTIPFFLLAAPTSIPAVEANVLPIVFAALLLDAVIVAVWYFMGVILTNDGVRESAKGEYYQFLGTAFLVVVLLWGISAFSGLSYTILGSTKLLSPSAMTSMCTNLESNSQLSILGSAESLLSGTQTASGKQLVGICNMLDGSTLTDKMNYPLAATAIVTANLTDQTANDLNGAYTYDAYIGFLSQLKPFIALCFAPPEAEQCWLPGGGIIGEYFRMSLTYAPYAGYSMLFEGIGVIGTLLNLSFESYVAQLLIITIVLYVWPYLLFGGIVLRSTFFTRKAGGLLIAIALGAIIVFPTIFGIEYLALGNGIPGATAITPYNTTYGFNALSPDANAISPIPSVTGIDANGNYIVGDYLLNFYVPPSMQQIAEANNCWPGLSSYGATATLLSGVALGPPGTGAAVGLAALATSGFPSPLASAELADIFYLLNPIGNAASGAGQLLSAAGTFSSGTFFLPSYCPVHGALSTNLEMMNAYGIIGVTSYFIPIINLIMTLSAIIGLSGLMGGNTSLEGLSRFV